METIELLKGSQLRHGESVGRNGRPTKEYGTWTDMKTRCNNPKATGYENYGGRGIKVCQRWQDSFEAFLADVGRAPSIYHTIDRTDNNGDYEPGNVQWKYRRQQMCNTRAYTGGRITIDRVRGPRFTLCKLFGLDPTAFSDLLKQGMTPQYAADILRGSAA